MVADSAEQRQALSPYSRHAVHMSKSDVDTAVLDRIEGQLNTNRAT